MSSFKARQRFSFRPIPRLQLTALLQTGSPNCSQTTDPNDKRLTARAIRFCARTWSSHLVSLVCIRRSLSAVILGQMRSAALNDREWSRTAPQTPAEKIQSDESSLDPSQRFWQKPVCWQTRLRRFLQKWALKHAGHGEVTFPRWLTTGSRVYPLAPHHLVSVQAVFFCPTIFLLC